MMWFLLGLNVSGLVLLADAMLRGENSSPYVVARAIKTKWEGRK